MIAATDQLAGRHRGAGWRLVACLILVAFALQSFITQSHIHDTSQNFGVATVLKIDAKTPAHKNAPPDDGSSNCATCQAIAHTGAFLAPAALSLLPALSGELAAPFIAVRTVAVSTVHNWQSRAPPRH